MQRINSLTVNIQYSKGLGGIEEFNAAKIAVKKAFP